MAENIVDIKVKINAETGALDVLGAKLDGVSKTSGSAKTAFSGLSGEAKSLAGSLGLLATSTGIVMFFASAIKGAEEEANAMRRLDATVQGVGENMEIARASNDEWLRVIDATTKFSDGEAIPVLEKFVRVTGDVDQAQSAAQLAMGLSTRTGKDLGQTVSFVTDLMNGNERAIKEARSEYSAFVGNATDTEVILARLGSEFRNAAFQQEGLTNSSARLRNAWGQFSDRVGDSLLGPLTTLVTWATIAVSKVDDFGTVLASGASKVFVFAQAVQEAFGSIKFDWTKIMSGGLTVDTGVIVAAQKRLSEKLAAIDQETEAQLAASEARKTANVLKNADTKLTITKDAQARRAADEEKQHADELEKKRQNDLKVLQMEAELDQRIAQLDGARLEQKIQAFDAEVAATRAKNLALDMSDAQRQAYLDKLQKYHTAQVKKATSEERLLRQSLAHDAITTGLSTLQTLNELGSRGSSAERARAKALLVLQQAVAIGWVWVAAAKQSAETGQPGLVSALAAAQTALIVANTAKGIDQIDQAAAQESQGVQATPTRGGVPGIDSAGGPGSSGGGGSGGGAVGGGGAGIVLTQHFSFTLHFDQLNADSVRPLARALADLVRANQTDGIQLALSMSNASRRNSGVAA